MWAEAAPWNPTMTKRPARTRLAPEDRRAQLVLHAVGCFADHGIARATQAQVAERAGVSVSAASSSARESERQASLTTQAMHDTCETSSTTSADAIDAVNAYVRAFNQGGPNVTATEQPAVEALNQSADAVASSMTAAIPQDLKDAFDAWVDGARATAKATADRVSPSEFNNAVDSVNETRSVALTLCDATY